MTGPLTGPISLPDPVDTARAVVRGIWGPPYVWVTLGSVALIFLAAMQSLAVTTVMPIVSADLDGGSLYALAFAGTLATSVIGMVITGTWSDRSGPVRPLYAAVALFVAGLVIAGSAPTMDLLVIGRLVQGLGVGGQTVALYVVVARVYPAVLHGRVFAAFSAAWVVPSLVGPFLAGAVAQYTHWRWVFIGVAILTVIAFVLVAAKLRGIAMDVEGQPATERFWLRLLLAIVLATSAVALSLAGRTEPPWMWIIVAVAIAAIALAIRPVTPRGTLRAAAGLPSVVLTRGVIAGAFFGAEVYIPYLLQQEYGFSATFSGLGLTTSALAWATGAELQGRFGDRLGNARITGIATSLLLTAITLAVLTAAFHLHPALLIGGWLLAGGGMGLLYPRLTVLTLAYSTPANQGFNSSALSISDALGSSMTIAAMGLVFVGLGSGQWAFTVVFAVAGLLALFTLVPGLRLGHAHEEQRVT